MVAGYGVKHGGIEWIGGPISSEEAACQEAEGRGAGYSFAQRAAQLS